MAQTEQVQSVSIQIANEFTVVQVRKVYTRNGERLEIESRKNGLKVHLDPMQLEALTLASPEVYTKLIEKDLEGEKE